MKHRKNTRQQDILFILISSFVVVVAWIAFNLFHIWTTSTIAPEIQKQLTPIAPDFDPATQQQLQTREEVVPLFEQERRIITPTPSIPSITPSISIPVASGSVSPSPSPSPTNEQVLEIIGPEQ
jgi:hypothetical protein